MEFYINVLLNLISLREKCHSKTYMVLGLQSIVYVSPSVGLPSAQVLFDLSPKFLIFVANR